MELSTAIDTMWVLLAAYLVFLMHAGHAQLNGDQKRNRRSDIWEPGEWFFFLSAFA